MFSKRTTTIILISTLLYVIWVFPVFAQEEQQAPSDASILESRCTTTDPVVGNSFQYFLKFDYKKDLNVHPVEHFSENGIRILDMQRQEPQEFEGRIIQQYEYTLRAGQKGTYQFSPVSIAFSGPRQHPVAALADPIQLTVSAVVDVRIVTNSPLMLGETLELSISITKNEPVAITAMPHELEAVLHVSATPEAENQDPSSEESLTATPEPTPQPAVLRFTLDQSQNIVPQQAEGKTVEQYKFLLAAAPEQAGEYVIPAVTITYRTSAGEDIEIQSETTSIFLLHPSTANHDIQTEYRFFILPAIIIGALVLGGLGGFLFLKYRKPRTQGELQEDVQLPPGELAHQELAEIQAMKLPAKGEFKRYYTLVSESVRKFLGTEYHFHVLERTTEEILSEIYQRNIPDTIQQQIITFLPKADMVKFAKYIPSLEETDDAMKQALKIVDESLEYHRPNVQTGEFSENSPTIT